MISMGFILIIFSVVILGVVFFHLVAYAIRWVLENRGDKDARGIFEAPISGVVPIFLEILCSFAVIILSVADFLIQLRELPWRRRIPVR
ncbi:MAG: hypothetical protein V3U53_08230, partial [bacterium]